MSAKFSEIVTTIAEIREAIGLPGARVLNKGTPVLDDRCRAFIARCPFLLLASADAGGNVDISPKGDSPGFVRVLDESTLAIPDRPGNRRADTFGNVLQRPNVGLLFLIPGKPEMLRAQGIATIVRDRWLRDSMAVDGEVPKLALVVTVGEVFFHCPKCTVRSQLWNPSRWPDLEGLASFAPGGAERSRASVGESEALVGGARKRLHQ